MARKARERYVIKNNRFHVNGHCMEGVEVIMIAPCSASGRQKDEKGKKLPKGDYDHFLLRYADKKQYRHLGIEPGDFAFSQKNFDTYFELVQDA